MYTLRILDIIKDIQIRHAFPNVSTIYTLGLSKFLIISVTILFSADKHHSLN